MSEAIITRLGSSGGISISNANKGTMPISGIDLSELDVTKHQWVRKIVFNNNLSISSSVILKLSSKYLSGTYRLNFSSSSIVLYNNSSATVSYIYSSSNNDYVDSFISKENIKWDYDTKTLSFDDCIYQFNIDSVLTGTLSSLSNVGTIYLDSVNGNTGTISPIDIRQFETNVSLSTDEGNSDYIGMTQKSITSGLTQLRDNAKMYQEALVPNYLLNFTNWNLVLLTDKLASYQAARYSGGSGISSYYGKMALVYDLNNNIVLKTIYKASNIGSQQKQDFILKDLSSLYTRCEFLLYADLSYYYIVDVKDKKVYRGSISVTGKPNNDISYISTLPNLEDISYYGNYYRILVVNGLFYIIKTSASSGTWTVCVSQDNCETWQSTEIEVHKVNFLRYINGIYYMGIYNSNSSPNYAILSSSDGINFTDINATNPQIYDVVYDSANQIWYGLSTSSWVSGSSIGEMTTVSGFTMYGYMLCRFSTNYPLGVMGFNSSGGNYLNNIYVTTDCVTSKDSQQTFPIINDNSFYTYHPLEASSTNSNITTIMQVNGNYYLAELQNYNGNPTVLNEIRTNLDIYSKTEVDNAIQTAINSITNADEVNY